MSVLKQDIQRRSEYLVNRLYDKVIRIALGGKDKTELHAHKPFIKRVLYLIHLEVRYNNVMYLKIEFNHDKNL